jgi:hypothetical protein
MRVKTQAQAMRAGRKSLREEIYDHTAKTLARKDIDPATREMLFNQLMRLAAELAPVITVTLAAAGGDANYSIAFPRPPEAKKPAKRRKQRGKTRK